MTLRVGACLSLSGKYARFGAQAGAALRVWQDLANERVDVIVEDDESDADTLRALLPQVAARCDVLLGPYSTYLTDVAAGVAADRGLLLWNHGGAGDHVHDRRRQHVVSVPTPASRYTEPFLRRLAGDPPPSMLCVAHGMGGFGRQVADGTSRLAHDLGMNTALVGAAESLPVDFPVEPAAGWDLLTAGSFGEDVRTLNHALGLPFPPRTICAVAAGVLEFQHAVADPSGIFGVAQWFPGHGRDVTIGPDEAAFVDAYTRVHGTAPEYPAAQAAAAAVVAAHCTDLTGSTRRDALWSAATALNARTLFGPFRISPDSGRQTAHDTVLVRWTSTGSLVAA